MRPHFPCALAQPGIACDGYRGTGLAPRDCMQTAPQAIAATQDSSPRLSGLVFELLVRSVGIALLGAGVLLTTLALVHLA